MTVALSPFFKFCKYKKLNLVQDHRSYLRTSGLLSQWHSLKNKIQQGTVFLDCKALIIKETKMISETESEGSVQFCIGTKKNGFYGCQVWENLEIFFLDKQLKNQLIFQAQENREVY